MTYVLCLYVHDDRARIQRFHVYRVYPPERNDPAMMLRVLDEYGEDHLYPAHWFVPVTLPAPSARAFRHAIALLTRARQQQLQEWTDEKGTGDR